MGYRSDVKYVMQFRDDEHCAEFVAVQKMKDGVYAEAAKDWEIKGDRIYFHAEDWKWYTGSYPIVDAHETMLDECSEFGGAYIFYRLGENDDDTDEKCSDSEDGTVEVPWDAICFHRYTEFQY